MISKLSKTKQLHARQALRFWRQYKNNSISSKKLIAKMVKAGWKHHNDGTYKSVLSKSSIVVKFNRRKRQEFNETYLEYCQYKCAEPEFKKHLAKIHGFYDGLLVQDKVFKKTSRSLRKKAGNIAEMFSLCDIEHNFGVSKAGTIKFHDFVDYYGSVMRCY